MIIDIKDCMMFEDDMKMTTIDKRDWSGSGLLERYSKDAALRNNLVFLFDAYIDDCFTRSHFSIVFIAILFNKINEDKEKFPLMNGSIYFDINDLIKYVEDNYNRVEDGLKCLTFIDWEAETYHMICSSYYNKLRGIFKYESNAKEYLSEISHRLPVDVIRNKKIDELGI